MKQRRAHVSWFTPVVLSRLFPEYFVFLSMTQPGKGWWRGREPFTWISGAIEGERGDLELSREWSIWCSYGSPYVFPPPSDLERRLEMIGCSSKAHPDLEPSSRTEVGDKNIRIEECCSFAHKAPSLLSFFPDGGILWMDQNQKEWIK